MINRVKRIVLDNKILLIINFLILCFICGYELKQYQGININIFSYIVIILTNHYYILYCMLPIILIIITKYIKNISSIEIIRYKNFFQQISKSVKIFIIFLFIYSLSHLILISTIGFNVFKLSSNQVIINQTMYDELISVLNKYIYFFNGNMVFAIILIVVYMVFGFTVLISLLSYINYKYGYKKTILFMILIYIFTFIGFKTEIKNILPIMCFNNFILLHHILFVDNVINFIFVVLIGVIIILFCLGKINIKNNFDNIIVTKKEILLTLIVPISIILLEVSKNVFISKVDFKNVVAYIFVGSSENFPSFVSWLSLLILYLTPLFFISISDSRLKQYGQFPFLIRFKNKADFLYRVENKYLKYILLYVLVIIVFSNLFFNLPFFKTSDNLFYFKISNTVLNLYFLIFTVYLLFDYVLFSIINKYFNNIFSILFIIFYKFILFLFPQFNFIYLNFGILNLYSNDHLLILKIIILAIIIILYFIRRFKNVNN